jgi:transposase
MYDLVQFYINERRDLVRTILLYCIRVFSYLWFYIQPDNGYIQPKNVADFCIDEVVFGP